MASPAPTTLTTPPQDQQDQRDQQQQQQQEPPPPSKAPAKPTTPNADADADPDPASDSDPDDLAAADLFADPPGFYPPSPPSKTTTYTTPAGAAITLHLVGHSPLEAHHLWNGARVMADVFHADPSLVAGRTVLELGAGAGLPSLVAAALGARRVVVTDFPDPELLEVLWRNVRGCALIPGVGPGGEVDDARLAVAVEGYVWGADPARVLRHLDEADRRRGFDVLVLADLLFRHSEHGNMLKTVRATLRRRRASRAYVVFTSYRPWLQHKDLAFFDLARERGFVVEKVLERKTERPLFEQDPGDEEVRKTVTGWTLRWPDDECEDAQ
ncbi:hypothetical protein VTJ83DRAFT_5463 [Remersonia thermophila]|uniref:Protein N-terminal and lysine N-methyltransferase EFM7 n=1 Tax=Remersonia thermophila TaxID=72144 RepID=A0ABR4D6X9_9PEZI